MMAVTFYRSPAQRAAQKTRAAQAEATAAATALHRLLERHAAAATTTPTSPATEATPLDAIDECVTRLHRLRATLQRHAALVLQLDAACRALRALRDRHAATLAAVDRDTAAAAARLRALAAERARLADRLAAARAELAGGAGDEEDVCGMGPNTGTTDGMAVSTRPMHPLGHRLPTPPPPPPLPLRAASPPPPPLPSSSSSSAAAAAQLPPLQQRAPLTIGFDADDASDADDELACAIGAHPLDITHSRNPASSSASLRDPSGSDGSLDDYDSNQIFYSSPRKQSLANGSAR